MEDDISNQKKNPDLQIEKTSNNATKRVTELNFFEVNEHVLKKYLS